MCCCCRRRLRARSRPAGRSTAAPLVAGANGDRCLRPVLILPVDQGCPPRPVGAPGVVRGPRRGPGRGNSRRGAVASGCSRAACRTALPPSRTPHSRAWWPHSLDRGVRPVFSQLVHATPGCGTAATLGAGKAPLRSREPVAEVTLPARCCCSTVRRQCCQSLAAAGGSRSSIASIHCRCPNSRRRRGPGSTVGRKTRSPCPGRERRRTRGPLCGRNAGNTVDV